MASLDVSDVPICAEFSDVIQVQQRPETISQYGRSQVSTSAPIAVLATIYPTGDNSLQRQTDHQFGRKTLTVVTPYRLRTSSPGAQPDYVFYRGNIFIVTEVRDFSQYGAGFVEEVCSSVESIDVPPQ